MKTCEDCRYSHGAPECTACGPDLTRYQPPETEAARLRDIAHQVEQRAAELTAGIDPTEQMVDPKLVKQCLDANERGDGILYATLNRGHYIYNVSVKDATKVLPWYRWNQHVWTLDEHLHHWDAAERVALAYQQQQHATTDQITDEGVDRNDKKSPGYHLIRQESNYRERVKRLRSENGIRKALRFAPIVDHTMACVEGDFNQQPWLLPVKNGVINLRTGVLEAGRPCDLLTKSLDIDYDPHADYAPWIEFLDQITDDPDVSRFLQRTFGYAATGHSYEQYIWVFVGPGRNGKGTLFDLIGDVLGPYYHQISRAMLIEQRNEPGPAAASEHKYSLLGKRVIVGDETNKGQKIDASAVKSLTGEDRINCRPNYRSEIVFKPTHTLFLHTNSVPRGLTADFALRQRLLLIEFPWMYVDDPEASAKDEPGKVGRFRHKDKHLKDRLRQCKQGILRWIVEGCLAWQRDGLAPPDTILAAVNQHAADEDYITQFMTDCLHHHPSAEHEHVRTSCSEIHRVFRWWWHQNMDVQERRTPGIKSINGQIRDKGHTVERSGGKYWLYRHTIDPGIAGEVDEWDKKGAKP